MYSNWLAEVVAGVKPSLVKLDMRGDGIKELYVKNPRGDEDQGYDIKYRAACVWFVLGSQVHLVFQISVYDFGAVPKEVFS